MRSYLSFLLIPLFASGVLAARASARSTAVESGFSARLSYLEGDVRLSLGREGQPYLGKQWIDASAGMALLAGYSVATGGGALQRLNSRTVQCSIWLRIPS